MKVVRSEKDVRVAILREKQAKYMAAREAFKADDPGALAGLLAASLAYVDVLERELAAALQR